jgi:hypothetical protein
MNSTNAIKFSEWFLNKLVIGKFPDYQVDYNTVINVSDEFNPIRSSNEVHWFPMNEAIKDCGLNSIYASMLILHRCESSNRSVYLHCHGGANRSVMVQEAYYYMRTGKHMEKTNHRLLEMCKRGLLPPVRELESFLKEINIIMVAKGYGFTGGVLDQIKLRTIRNF